MAEDEKPPTGEPPPEGEKPPSRLPRLPRKRLKRKGRRFPRGDRLL